MGTCCKLYVLLEIFHGSSSARRVTSARAETSSSSIAPRSRAPPSASFYQLAMRDVDVARLLRDDGDGEAGARSPPKTPENVTSERMDEDAPAWEDARAAKAKGDAHVKVRAEPRLERYRARARLRATRTGPRPPRDRPASTAPLVSRDGPSPTFCLLFFNP